jgi:CRISPR-associated protein Cas1
MPPLYINQQGTHIRKRDQQIVISKEGQILQALPLHTIEHLIIMGRGIQISTALLISLLETGIPVTLTDQQGSRHYATLAPSVSRFGQLRSQQMAFVHNPSQALELARAIIVAKIQAQRDLLAQMKWPSTPSAISQTERVLHQIQQATSMDMLRGYEGAAAAAYFGAWRASLPQAWRFEGRSFYPPTDPVNAMLSFGYTLLLNDILVAIQISGLDPYLGTFHVIEVGRPSLALDLIEEFRPLLIDRLVLTLIHQQQVAPHHFERPRDKPEAVYLNAEGRAALLKHYASLLQSQVDIQTIGRTTWRYALQLQTQQVVRVMRAEQAAYQALQIQ